MYAGSAPNCLHRFSSTLTVLYWSIDNSLRPSNLWFSSFLFTGKDQTNSTNCAFPICQTPFHYLHEIGKKIGSLERMTVLEWLFMCLSLDREKEQKFQLLSKCLPSNLCQLQLVYIIHVGKVNWEFWNYLFLLLGQIYMLKCSLKGNIETFKLKKKVSCIDEHLQNKNVNQFLHFI